MRRALERGIDEKEIQKYMENLIETLPTTREGKFKSYIKVIDPYTKKSMYILIIHKDLNKEPVIIISVMPIDKGGLREHGFHNV